MMAERFWTEIGKILATSQDWSFSDSEEIFAEFSTDESTSPRKHVESSIKSRLFELPSSRSLKFTSSRTVPVKTVEQKNAASPSFLPIGCRWNQTFTKGGLQRCPDSERPFCSEFPRGFLPQKGMGGQLKSGVKEWIRQCLPRSRNHKRSPLVCDSFWAHLTDDVKVALREQKIDVINRLFEYTPSGKRKPLTRNLVLRSVNEALGKKSQQKWS